VTYIETDTGLLNWKGYGGEGEPIVLVHGLGGSSLNWDAVGPDLARHGKAVAIDLPGFGLSPPARDWSTRTNSEAVAGFISKIGGPATLVGNSMGGLVTTLVAAERPELVSRLVLVSPAMPPRPPDMEIDWPTALRLTVQATPGLGEAVARYYRRRYSPQEFVQLSLKRIVHRPSRIPPDLVEELVRLAETRYHLPWAVDAVPQGARAVATTWRRRGELVARVRAISCPTLVIQGTADPIVPPSAVRWLTSLRSDWAHVEMPDTGHTPQLDAPVRFYQAISGWLREQQPSLT
jgi:pimeloyl-ACP methyl ester carboxylesterase